MTVTLLMPCRTDEPAVEATLGQVQAAWQHGGLGTPRLSVCVNGAGGADAPIARALRAWSAVQDLPFAQVDIDTAAVPPFDWSGVRVLRTERPGKARAWNWLRRTTRTPAVIFLDADVEFAPDVPAALLQALVSAPAATLASARTQAIVRASALERIQAVPYAFPFENLSPQLYAARTDRLPAAIPEDLLDPERWLELIVGYRRIVHAPGAIVSVRLAATWRDFFRQRIRLEQAKRQLACEYPGLGGRGQPPPQQGTVRRHYAPADLARLVAYLGLRTVAAAIGRWRQRTGRVEVAWRQATSTKEPR